MNKVLQAAGRVIRDVSDRGVVLLLDQRFRTPRYQELFPLHWQHALQIRRPQELSKALTHFWQEKTRSRAFRRGCAKSADKADFA